MLIYWTHTLIACRRCRRRVVAGTRALFGTCAADGWRSIPPTQVSADENYHTRVLGKRRESLGKAEFLGYVMCILNIFYVVGWS